MSKAAASRGTTAAAARRLVPEPSGRLYGPFRSAAAASDRTNTGDDRVVLLSNPPMPQMAPRPEVRRVDSVAPVRNQALRQLLAYWHDKRGERALPGLRDIDPTDIPAVLGQVWLCDRLADSGRFRFRLAGEKINAFWGYSIAGKHLDEIVPPDRLESAGEKFRMVCELPAIVHDRVCLSLTEEIVCNGERMILPLSDDGGYVNVLFGAAHCNWGQNLEFDPYVSYSETTTVTAL